MVVWLIGTMGFGQMSGELPTPDQARLASAPAPQPQYNMNETVSRKLQDDANSSYDNILKSIPSRLEKQRQQGCPVNTLLSFYFEYWKLIVKDGQPDHMTALLKFNERLTETLPDSEIKDQLILNAVDGYFVMEDYGKALQLLKEPLAIMSPAMREQSINKIKAHRALQRGNKKEAIKRFRAFMDEVKTWPNNPTLHPLTGQIYTKQMYLAANAKRIGDILTAMNNTLEAAEAYREAAYYYIIMTNNDFPANSPENQYIKARKTELIPLLKTIQN